MRYFTDVLYADYYFTLIRADGLILIDDTPH
jgi:hypothetical protein